MNDLGWVIRRIQVTEKGTALAAQNKYLFEVDPRATKHEIRRAVESYFKVAVATVNTMKYEGKKKTLRMARYGKRPDWKRAVVTLKEGSKIELT